MSSQAWHTYLRPHRSPETPAAMRLVLAILSGAILSLSYRGSFSSLYTWVCLALLLACILGSRGAVAFACGFLHGLVFCLTCVPWIADVLSVHGGMPMAAGWGVLLLIASVWGAIIGLFALAVQRLSKRSMPLALVGAPFLWISTEVARTFLPEISFPWALLGYPAAGNPALVQLTTITGIYGVSFVVAAFNALLVWSDSAPTPQFTESHRLNRSRECTASQAAEKAPLRHSERSLRSEESLFSWISAKKRLLASLRMTNQTTFSAASSAVPKGSEKSGVLTPEVRRLAARSIFEGGIGRRWAIVAAVAAVLLLIAWVGPRFVPKAEAHHVARVVQPNFPEYLEYAGDWYADHKADMEELERLSLRPSPVGHSPDLLIWPEAPAPFSFGDPRFGPLISHLAQEFHHPVVVGVIEWKPGTEIVHGVPQKTLVPYNSAAMLNEWGQRTFSYDKMHLVPFGEYEPFPLIHQVVTSVSEEVGGFRKGKERAVGKFSNGNTFSVFICYEAIYPGEVREFAARGAQLLINISNDGWFGTSQAAEQHLRMARVRAVENRRWLVRDTNSGISASIDPYGNMLRVMKRDTRDAADLPYDFRTDKTIYSHWGDWFAWMCVGVSVILVLVTLRKAK
jgi:apolipoprotein N-acyltransferase